MQGKQFGDISPIRPRHSTKNVVKNNEPKQSPHFANLKADAHFTFPDDSLNDSAFQEKIKIDYLVKLHNCTEKKA